MNRVWPGIEKLSDLQDERRAAGPPNHDVPLGGLPDDPKRADVVFPSQREAIAGADDVLRRLVEWYALVHGSP
jgi:hypothetical protein